MACKKFERLLYLYDDESKSKRQKFLKHFQACPHCRAEWQSLRNFTTKLNVVRKNVPTVANESQLTQAILRRIRADLSTKEKVSFGDRLLNGFVDSGFRWVLVGLVILSLNIFVWQESLIYQKINRLEEKATLATTRDVPVEITLRRIYQSYLSTIRQQSDQNHLSRTEVVQAALVPDLIKLAKLYNLDLDKLDIKLLPRLLANQELKNLNYHEIRRNWSGLRPKGQKTFSHSRVANHTR